MNQHSIDKVLRSRTKHFPGEAYKLLNTSVAPYGLDVAFVEALEVDTSAMAVTIPFADGKRRDGVGDLLEIGGIDTSRHIKNPVVLFDHAKQVTLPIGKCEDPNGNYSVELDTILKTARAKAFFYQGKSLPQGGDEEDVAYTPPSNQYEHAVLSEQIYDLLAKRFIRAGSIGYQVLQGQELPADYNTGTPQGVHLLKTLLLEVSVVVLPANADTVGKALSMSRICGKPISPILVKSLAPYAPQRKTMPYPSKGQARPSATTAPDQRQLAWLQQQNQNLEGQVARLEQHIKVLSQMVRDRYGVEGNTEGGTTC